jgi:hypothetical protein
MKRQLIYHTPISIEEINKSVETVNVMTENNTFVRTELKSISRDGINLTCNQHTLHRLLPNSASVSPKQAVQLSVEFDLDKTVSADCKVVYARRLSKDTFQLELIFIDMSVDSSEALDVYVEKSLKQLHKSDLNQQALSKVA